MLVARQGEDSRTHFRTDRFYRVNEVWFFSTREGIEMGPYASRSEAELALSDLTIANNWGEQKDSDAPKAETEQLDKH